MKNRDSWVLSERWQRNFNGEKFLKRKVNVQLCMLLIAALLCLMNNLLTDNTIYGFFTFLYAYSAQLLFVTVSHTDLIAINHGAHN